MKQMVWSLAEAIFFSVAWLIVALLVVSTWQSAHADNRAIGAWGANPAHQLRSGGAVEESYHYHRQAQPVAEKSIPATGYRYGFPVESFRWGWFGAARYYPTVFWHRGYNGDDCRYAYRCGY